MMSGQGWLVGHLSELELRDEANSMAWEKEGATDRIRSFLKPRLCQPQFGGSSNPLLPNFSCTYGLLQGAAL